MANQSVRQTTPFVEEAHPLEQYLTSPFIYSPLDFSIDGIRLLILEPAEDTNSLIRCTLQHVVFFQKPKYEALSYTWGSEIVRHRISIDGKDFEIGQNLFDALSHLRDPLHSRTLWVDAICINQSDVLEKNHQIGIMPFIYMHQLLNWEETFHSEKFLFMVQGAKELLHTLCGNPYWKRVWIVQEVGLVKKLLVHYEAHTVDWTTFIKRIQSYVDLQGSLPVKLQKQRDEKYENSHKLQALIESHQDSLCKEPRDHVYGFVGLAIDCQEGFPTDYGKSLYYVWKDVIRFKNAGQPKDLESPFQKPDIDTLRFGRLVLRLLGGPKIVTADEDLNIVFSFDREIVCPKSYTSECMRRVDQKSKPIDVDNSTLPANSKPISKDPRLFLLGGVHDYGDGSAGKVGLAPANARVGDYVFLIDGIEKAVVVRREEGRVRVVGTAATAENRYLARAVKDGGLKREKRFGTTNLKYKHIDGIDRLDLFVDVATAYELMS